jgi:organic hydroperoxide reductase OsmC/OhrA
MSGRARVFSFEVALDEEWDVASDRGGAELPGSERESWTPEHLVLAGLCRCVLTSLAFHALRAGIDVVPRAKAEGTVTRREEDGRFAFVEIVVELDVQLDPAPDRDACAALAVKAERDCFVGASLTVPPLYHWIINGREIG